MSVPGFLPCLAIIVLSSAVGPVQGRELSGRIDSGASEEAKLLRRVAAGAPEVSGRAAEPAFSADDELSAEKARTERKRRQEADRRFGMLILFSQILRGPK